MLLLFSFDTINDLKSEQFQGENRLEITGHFKKIELAYKDEVIITLTNEKQYSISSIMYHSKMPVFQIDEFIHEVKYGDRLYFTVWDNFIIMDVVTGILLVTDLIKYMVTKKKREKVMTESW